MVDSESNDPNDFFGQADDVKFVKNFASYKIKIETAEGDSTTEKAFHRASIDIKNMIYKDNRIKFEGIVLFTSALAARFIMRNVSSFSNNCTFVSFLEVLFTLAKLKLFL